MQEWPILIFTFMLTTSVGLVGATALYGVWLSREFNAADVCKTLRLPLLVSSVLSIIALAASFGHLGYPMNAPNAIRHLASSWLSREIVFVSCFIGAICLTTLLALKTGKVSLLFVALSFLVGIAAVLSMGEIYRNSSVVTWMHAQTHVMFLGSLLLTGPVLALLLIDPATRAKASPALMRKLLGTAVLCAALGILAQLLLLPSYVMAINNNPLNDVVTYPLHPFAVYQTYATARVVRWLLSIAGLFLLAFTMWKSLSRQQQAYGLISLAALALFSGELLGRYVFYAIHG